MVLRKSDFAAWRINWKDKAENLLAVAEELNLGLDSFVFLDESPQGARSGPPSLAAGVYSRPAGLALRPGAFPMLTKLLRNFKPRNGGFGTNGNVSS